MRAHARIEDHIRRLEAFGLERLPFSDLEVNQRGSAVVCFAADLVPWFQLLCLAGHLAAGEPKTQRWELWHTLARVVRRSRRRVVRVLDGWSTTCHPLQTYQRLALIIRAPYELGTTATACFSASFPYGAIEPGPITSTPRPSRR